MTRSDTTHHGLAKSTLIRLPGTARDIYCDAGTLWITQDGDPRDIVLEAGQQHRRQGQGAAIVYALAPAQLRVRHELQDRCQGGSRSAQPTPSAIHRSTALQPRALVQK